VAVTPLDDKQVLRHSYDDTNKAIRVRVAGPIPCPDTIQANGDLEASQCAFSVNEGTGVVTIKVKYADGTTVVTGVVTTAS
jgi:hypothetical protein